MKTNWPRRIGGAFVMAVIWAAIWAFVAVMIGSISASLPGDPLGWILDPWLAAALPGFVGGVVYCVVLWLAERGRRVHEVPLPRIAAWGAVAGVLLGVFPFVAGTPTDRVTLWLLMVGVIGSTTLLSTISAIGSALLFRHVARAQPPARGGVGGVATHATR